MPVRGRTQRGPVERPPSAPRRTRGRTAIFSKFPRCRRSSSDQDRSGHLHGHRPHLSVALEITFHVELADEVVAAVDEELEDESEGRGSTRELTEDLRDELSSLKPTASVDDDDDDTLSYFAKLAE